MFKNAEVMGAMIGALVGVMILTSLVTFDPVNMLLNMAIVGVPMALGLLVARVVRPPQSQ